jgi:hypothetical protein
MGKCLPGMSCFGKSVDAIVYTTYPKGCETESPSPTTLPIGSNNLFYSGPNLPYTEIETLDNLSVALQKIDLKLSPTSIFNLLISAIHNDPSLKIILCNKIGECP